MSAFDFVEHMCLEGEEGVEALNVIADTLGYEKTGFKYGSSFEQFLCDNPNCVQAIMTWIDKQNIPEWADLLHIEEEEEDESFDCK
jgi:hypothetical protein